MSRSDQVRQAIADGDYTKALSIACRFKMKISKEDQAALQRAHECQRNRGFYESLGRNCDELLATGIQVLNRLYNPETGSIPSALTLR